jgi:magnesium transporter
MICTYLYNTANKRLEVLDSSEMLEAAPDEAQINEKRTALRERKYKGAAFRGVPRCRDGEFVWIDVTDPSAQDYELLSQRFNLHPMVVEDIRTQEGRPKLHNYTDYLYIIFFAVQWRECEDDDCDADPKHNPTVEAAASHGIPNGSSNGNLNGAGGAHESQVPVRRPWTRRGREAEEQENKPSKKFELNVVEVDCLVGPDFVVTLHKGPLAPLDDLRDRWLRRPEMMKTGTGYLLYEVMDEVLDDYFPLLDALDERIDDFEERLFHAGQSSGGGGNLSSDIFALKRSLVQVRRVAGPTRDVVNILLRHDADTGGKNFAYYQDLYDHASRIVDQIDTFREIVAGALDAYLATESNRTNQVMKTLTACSIILFVPNLIAAIYGMNFEYMPELKAPGAYFLIIGIMANVMALLAAYFKRLGWF